MQLYLATDELDLIANILLQREGQLSGPLQEGVASTQPGVELKLCEELLDRVLARDMEFDSDELEQLAEILAREKEVINKLTAQQQGAPLNPLVQRKRIKLERVLEKIDEVCAMI